LFLVLVADHRAGFLALFHLFVCTIIPELSKLLYVISGLYFLSKLYVTTSPAQPRRSRLEQQNSKPGNH
jgi:hypothetical protein